MTLSVIVPTCGRLTLFRAVTSALLQCRPGDEVIVCGDGPQPQAEAAAKNFGIRYLEGPSEHRWGHAQRNFAIPHATGDYLVFLDDDDAFVPNAFQAFRDAIAETPGRPIFFRFIDKNGCIIWRTQKLEQGDISTQCLCLPNLPGKVGTWGDRYEGDYDMAVSTLALWEPGAEVWRPNIVQVAG